MNSQNISYQGLFNTLQGNFDSIASTDGTFTNLQSTNGTITNLQSTNGTITDLQFTNGTFTGTLTTNLPALQAVTTDTNSNLTTLPYNYNNVPLTLVIRDTNGNVVFNQVTTNYLILNNGLTVPTLYVVPNSNNTTTFRVENSTGTYLLNCDTTDMNISFNVPLLLPNLAASALLQLNSSNQIIASNSLPSYVTLNYGTLINCTLDGCVLGTNLTNTNSAAIALTGTATSGYNSLLSLKNTSGGGVALGFNTGVSNSIISTDGSCNLTWNMTSMTIVPNNSTTSSFFTIYNYLYGAIMFQINPVSRSVSTNKCTLDNGSGGISCISLNVSGNTSLNTLSTSSTATLNSLSVTNSATLNTLTTLSTATLNSLSVQNNASVAGNLSVTGSQTFTGPSTFASSVTLDYTLYVNSTTTLNNVLTCNTGLTCNYSGVFQNTGTGGVTETVTISAGSIGNATTNNTAQLYFSTIGGGGGNVPMYIKSYYNTTFSNYALSFLLAGCYTFDAPIYPTTDASYSFGESGYRWGALWSSVGTIQTSDNKNKYDITELTNSLSFINDLKPYSYKLNSDKKTYFGLIAQDVEQSFIKNKFDSYDGCIHKPKNTTESYGMNYSNITAFLVGAVQDLTKQVNSLNQQVILLNQKIIDLQPKK